MSGSEVDTTQDRNEKLKLLQKGQTVRLLGSLAAVLTLGAFAFTSLSMPENTADYGIHHWMILAAVFIVPPALMGAGYWCGFRCPFCHRGFGTRTFFVPKFCARCGEHLEP
jgi:hypothetical protein